MFTTVLSNIHLPLLHVKTCFLSHVHAFTSPSEQALEAQIWVMNDRHHTLKLESTALWRTVLEEGDGRLRTKAREAMAAVQRVVSLPRPFA